jgi:hypothetical protein
LCQTELLFTSAIKFHVAKWFFYKHFSFTAWVT